jgi:hypothetical protein
VKGYTSDRPFNTQNISIASTKNQTAIAPPQHPKSQSPQPKIKQRSPPQSKKSNSDRPFNTQNHDRLSTKNQTAITFFKVFYS